MRTAGSGSESATRIMKAIRANMATPSLTVEDDTEEDNVSQKYDYKIGTLRGGLMTELNEKLGDSSAREEETKSSVKSTKNQHQSYK